MSDRIEQCKADIATLQEELKRLEAKPKARHGDIVQFCNYGKRIIIKEGGHLRAYDQDGNVQSSRSNPTAIQEHYDRGTYTVTGNVFDEGK